MKLHHLRFVVNVQLFVWIIVIHWLLSPKGTVLCSLQQFEQTASSSQKASGSGSSSSSSLVSLGPSVTVPSSVPVSAYVISAAYQSFWPRSHWLRILPLPSSTIRHTCALRWSWGPTISSSACSTDSSAQLQSWLKSKYMCCFIQQG